MNVTLPSGEVVENVPDDMTKDEFMAMANANNLELSKDVGESAKPLQVVREANPDKRPDYQAQYDTRVEDRNTYEREVHDRGPEAYARMLEARDMGSLDKSAIVAGRETNKLLAGAGRLSDAAEYITLPQDIDEETAMPTTGRTGNKYFDLFNKYSDYMSKSHMQRDTARNKYQKSSDKLYQEFDEEKGLASVASMLPYMVSGLGAGPIASKIGQGMVKAVTTPVAATYKGGKGLLTKAVEASAKAGVPLTKKMKTEWTDPLAKRAFAKANRKKEPLPWREGFLSDVLGGGVLGATESGVHFDNNPIDGAMAGVGGSTFGRFVKPILTRTKPVYSKADQDIINYADSQGFKYFPGGKTGDIGKQMFESGLRSDKRWGESMARVDRNNRIIMNEKAYEAMGIPKGSIPQLTPKLLDTHIKGLKTEYDDLVNNSTARFSGKSIQKLRDGLDPLSKSQSKAGEEAYFAAQNQFDEILNRLHATRDKKTGKYLLATFSGKDYQDMSRYIKDEISMAYKSGNDGVVRALKPFQEALEEAMDNGIKYGGKVSSAQWKDLNERYAMSRMLIDKGLDITGKFDPQTFSTYLMSNDAYRTLTEKGGRIVPLQKLAKANFLSSQHAGSDMTGTGLGSHKITRTQAFLGTPFGKMLPLIDDAYLGLYRRGWPGTTGLLNLSGKGFGDTMLYTRAQAQGQQQHPKAVKAMLEAKDWTSDKLDEVEKFRMSLFE